MMKKAIARPITARYSWIGKLVTAKTVSYLNHESGHSVFSGTTRPPTKAYIPNEIDVKVKLARAARKVGSAKLLRSRKKAAAVRKAAGKASR